MNDPHLLQTAAIGAVLIAVVALAALGYRPARRFIHGIFHGAGLYSSPDSRWQPRWRTRIQAEGLPSWISPWNMYRRKSTIP